MGTLGSGRGGIRPETLALIRRLLCKGLAYRAIAKQAGVCRKTVAKIACDQHAAELPSYERCPGCGGRVIMPCRGCLVGNLRNRAAVSPRR